MSAGHEVQSGAVVSIQNRGHAWEVEVATDPERTFTFQTTGRPPRAGAEVSISILWNDGTDADFEVIDTLRSVAKDLRNEAKS